MTNPTNTKKIAFFLPNTFTALNLACGFMAVIFAMRGEFYKSCMILILGGIFDSVDGRVARLTGTQSSFGEQFDSMSDVVSFGVAPAFIIYLHTLNQMGRIGIIASFIYLLCGALRLARFNANIDRVGSDYFQGLPIPGAAIAVMGFIFFSLEYPILKDYPVVAAIYVVFYGFLMISNIPFNSFKKSKWVKNHKRQTLLVVFLLISLIFIYEQLMVGVYISLYVGGSLVYFFINKGQFADIFKLQENPEDELHVQDE